MGKQEILRKRKKSTKSVGRLSDCCKWDPTAELLDKRNLAEALVECLLNNDPEGMVEMIEIYLQAVERTKFAKKSDIPRATLYHFLKNKNPTLKTLAKLFRGIDGMAA